MDKIFGHRRLPAGEAARISEAWRKRTVSGADRPVLRGLSRDVGEGACSEERCARAGLTDEFTVVTRMGGIEARPRRYPGQHPAGGWLSAFARYEIPPHCRYGGRAAVVARVLEQWADHDRGHVGSGVEAGRDAKRVRVVAGACGAGRGSRASLDSFPEEFHRGACRRARRSSATPGCERAVRVGVRERSGSSARVLRALQGARPRARERLLASPRRSWHGRRGG